MWVILIGNSPAFTNELSRAAFKKELNMDGKSYERAWRELKEKGYAVLKEGSKNTYLILEEPIKIIPLQTEGDNNPDKIEGDNIPPKIVDYPPQNCPLSPSKLSFISPKIDVRNREHINRETEKERFLHSSASQSNEESSTPKPPKGASPRVEEKVGADFIEISLAELRAMAQQGLSIDVINKKRGLFRGNGVIYKAV